MAHKKPNIKNPTDRFGKFLNDTDLKELKDQKSALYIIQSKMEKPKAKFTQKEWNALEGLINFVESIQTIAVDEYGIKETKVFKISRKEK